MVNFRKIKGRAIEKLGGMENFSRAMGWSNKMRIEKLSGKVRINTNDIEKMIAPDVLDIPREDIHEYFFCE